MTKLEMIVVRELYGLHCEIVDKLKTYYEVASEAEKEIYKAQLDRMDDKIMDLHDALVHPDL